MHTTWSARHGELTNSIERWARLYCSVRGTIETILRLRNGIARLYNRDFEGIKEENELPRLSMSLREGCLHQLSCRKCGAHMLLGCFSGDIGGKWREWCTDGGYAYSYHTPIILLSYHHLYLNNNVDGGLPYSHCTIRMILQTKYDIFNFPIEISTVYIMINLIPFFHRMIISSHVSTQFELIHTPFSIHYKCMYFCMIW